MALDRFSIRTLGADEGASMRAVLFRVGTAFENDCANLLKNMADPGRKHCK